MRKSALADLRWAALRAATRMTAGQAPDQGRDKSREALAPQKPELGLCNPGSLASLGTRNDSREMGTNCQSEVVQHGRGGRRTRSLPQRSRLWHDSDLPPGLGCRKMI